MVGCGQHTKQISTVPPNLTLGMHHRLPHCRCRHYRSMLSQRQRLTWVPARESRPLPHFEQPPTKASAPPGTAAASGSAAAANHQQCTQDHLHCRPRSARGRCCHSRHCVATAAGAASFQQGITLWQQLSLRPPLCQALRLPLMQLPVSRNASVISNILHCGYHSASRCCSCSHCCHSHSCHCRFLARQHRLATFTVATALPGAAAAVPYHAHSWPTRSCHTG